MEQFSSEIDSDIIDQPSGSKQNEKEISGNNIYGFILLQ